METTYILKVAADGRVEREPFYKWGVASERRAESNNPKEGENK